MKDGTKVLCVCGCFRLPDDFEGEFSDALRAWADYHENEGINNPKRKFRNTVNETPSADASLNTIWPDFLEALSNGSRCTVAVSIGAYNAESKEFERIVDVETEKERAEKKEAPGV